MPYSGRSCISVLVDPSCVLEQRAVVFKQRPALVAVLRCAVRVAWHFSDIAQAACFKAELEGSRSSYPKFGWPLSTAEPGPWKRVPTPKKGTKLGFGLLGATCVFKMRRRPLGGFWAGPASYVRPYPCLVRATPVTGALETSGFFPHPPSPTPRPPRREGDQRPHSGGHLLRVHRSELPPRYVRT